MLLFLGVITSSCIPLPPPVLVILSVWTGEVAKFERPPSWAIAEINPTCLTDLAGCSTRAWEGWNYFEFQVLKIAGNSLWEFAILEHSGDNRGGSDFVSVILEYPPRVEDFIFVSVCLTRWFWLQLCVLCQWRVPSWPLCKELSG